MKLGLIISLATTAVLLAACDHLPVDGPSPMAVNREATETKTVGARDVGVNYVLVDINRTVIDNVDRYGPESFFKTFGTGKGPAPVARLGVGDVLAVSVFESSSGGLFTTGDVGGRPGSFTPLPPQAVDERGNISIPYAGEIHAAHRSVAEVRKDIEMRLAPRAIEPQVVLSVVEQSSTAVSIFGDAALGSIRTKITPGGERILDVIAKVGIKYPGYEVFVKLRRGQTDATMFLPALVERSEENIYVHPGDILYLFRQQQAYIAVGALGSATQTTGLTGRLTFDAAHLSLAEAVAKPGGLLDTRADPRQVLLYRLEHRATLERMGMSLDHFNPDEKLIPTIYRANYRDPSVFFMVDQFPMRHRDIIYIGNSDSTEYEKFLIDLRVITGTVAGVSSDALSTRDSLRALFNK